MSDSDNTEFQLDQIIQHLGALESAINNLSSDLEEQTRYLRQAVSKLDEVKREIR